MRSRPPTVSPEAPTHPPVSPSLDPFQQLRPFLPVAVILDDGLSVQPATREVIDAVDYVYARGPRHDATQHIIDDRFGQASNR